MMQGEGVRVIRARPKDKRAIAKLIKDAGIGPNKDGSEPDIRTCRFWVAIARMQVVGCAGVEWHGRKAVILVHCVVREEFRKRGIGRMFVKVRMQEARQRGKTIAALSTSFRKGRHYRNLGFDVCRRALLPKEIRSFRQFTTKRYMRFWVMWRWV
jgi:N-acetylglutamate synthase-like GNAT family acetyltransferase